MTDATKFREHQKRSGLAFCRIAELLGISAQTLYNKVGNFTEFTASELVKIREIFPNMTDEEFNETFMVKGDR